MPRSSSRSTPEDRDLFESRYRPNVAFLNITVLDGGEERHDTVARALELVDPSCEFVAVHDAARPCVTTDLIDLVFDAARLHGAALPGVAVADTLKRVGPDRSIVETVPRAGLFGVQTPQAFRLDLLIRAYAERSRLGSSVTDDAMLVEALGHRCVVVDGSPLNLKITTSIDLRLASAVLASLPKPEATRPLHPFADESAMQADEPKRTLDDLF